MANSNQNALQKKKGINLRKELKVFYRCALSCWLQIEYSWFQTEAVKLVRLIIKKVCKLRATGKQREWAKIKWIEERSMLNAVKWKIWRCKTAIVSISFRTFPNQKIYKKDCCISQRKRWVVCKRSLLENFSTSQILYTIS